MLHVSALGTKICSVQNVFMDGCCVWINVTQLVSLSVHKDNVDVSFSVVHCLGLEPRMPSSIFSIKNALICDSISQINLK